MPPLPSRRSSRYFPSRTCPTYCSSEAMRELMPGVRVPVQSGFEAFQLKVGTVTPLMPVSILPSSFTQLFVAPKSFLQLDTWLSIVRFPDYCNNVVTKGRIHQAEHSAIAARRARDLPAFAQINIGLRWREFVRSPGLDLDKTKDGAVVGDYVNLGINDCLAPVASNWQREIGGDDPVAATFQVLNGQRFAARAQLKSLSDAGFRFRNELVISHCSNLLCGGRFLLRSFLFFRTGRSGRRRRALTLP